MTAGQCPQDINAQGQEQEREMFQFLDDLILDLRAAVNLTETTERRIEKETPRAYLIYLVSNAIVFGVGWGSLLTVLLLAVFQSSTP